MFQNLTLVIALCPDLVDPENGKVVMTGNSVENTVGDTAVYSCDDGYSLSGVDMVICLEDGQWSDHPPTCVLRMSSIHLIIIISFSVL